MRGIAALGLVLGTWAAVACSQGGGDVLSPLAQQGRSVYRSNCSACHALDPAQDGALGPAVAGASRELLEARVVRGEYPPGYTPKRSSGAMLAMPHLAGEIDALSAYLSEVARR